MIFGGAETDHRSDAVLTSLPVVDVIDASLVSVAVVIGAVVVVTTSDSLSSLTRGGAETTVTRASSKSDLGLKRKLRKLRLDNDVEGGGAGDVLLVTSAGRALKYCTIFQLCIAVDFVTDVVLVVVD